MCRFAFYLGPELTVAELVTEPNHSILHQSFAARERIEPLNGDGFGVAWFDRAHRIGPAVLREVHPAWNSLNLAAIAPHARGHCLMAHVRAASTGLSVSQLNCHPFARDGFAFMHNGEIADFMHTRRKLRNALSDDSYEQVAGSTDSETLFGLIIDNMDSKTDPENWGDAMRAAIGFVEEAAAAAGSVEPSYLNLVLTDGHAAVVCRYVTPGRHPAQSLYVHTGARYNCVDGVCYMDTDEIDQCILISSEPLNDQGGWEPFPTNELWVIRPDLTVDRKRMKPVRSLDSSIIPGSLKANAGRPPAAS